MDKTMVVDLPGALSRADGDQDLFLTLAGLFLQESPKEAEAARVALERQDRAGLAAAAHKLKGSVMEMCAPRLFDLAVLQRGGRIGQRGVHALQVGLFEVVAAAVRVGELVEGRHHLARHAALDREDQFGAIELRRPQVGAIGHLAVHFAAIGRPPVTRLAISFLLEQPPAFREIARIGPRAGLCMHACVRRHRERHEENGRRRHPRTHQRVPAATALCHPRIILWKFGGASSWSM